MRNLWVIMIILGIHFLAMGSNTTSKAAMSRGMSNLVFMVYSHAFALLILFPSTFIYHKFITPIPPIPFPILCRLFLFTLISYLAQLCTNVGIGYSSPTLNSSISNLTPAFTFLLAILTGLEKVDLRVHSSQAKSIGTLISIGGAFVINFYKGPPIISHLHSLPIILNEPLLLSTQPNWIFGGFLFAMASFLFALMIIVQTWIMKDYPEVLMVSLLACIIVTMESTIVALIAGLDSNAWKLEPDIKLAAICFSAIVMVSLRNMVFSWALHLKGPIFVTNFSPLDTVFAVILGVTFLHDTVYVGSVIGAAIIALGFYSVMWGKAKEAKAINEENDLSSSHSSSTKAPLLQTLNANV